MSVCDFLTALLIVLCVFLIGRCNRDLSVESNRHMEEMARIRATTLPAVHAER